MGHSSPWIACDGFPYLGRSVVLGSKHTHLWGATASPTATRAAFQRFVQGDIFIPTCTHGPAGLFQITSAAREFQRASAEVTIFPLGDNAANQPPAGVDPPTLRTQVQLRVTANDGTSTRVFEMDCNQSICIVAQDVCVQWLGPVGTRDVQNWTTVQLAGAGLTGFVFDAFLEVGVSRIEAAPGDNSSVILTQHLPVPANTVPTIAIPAYAEAVTIYQAVTLGNASVMWTQHIGDPAGIAGSMEIGAIPFIPGQRKTQPNIELGHATHLQPDIDNAERFFTLVWTIRP